MDAHPVYSKHHRGTNWLDAVHRSDGQVAKFGGLKDIAQVGETIKAESAIQVISLAVWILI